jgi:hypothetical protein
LQMIWSNNWMKAHGFGSKHMVSGSGQGML